MTSSARDAPRRVVVDTDTAGDDAVAILLATLSERLAVEGLTIVAGNAAFEREVENAKYALDLADATGVPVHEGARAPLVKTHETAENVHGEGGLGGELFPDTGIESAEEHAVEYLVGTARENPGEVSVLCLGPLTNLALALAREPALPELLDSVWVMGGAANCLGNVTPAAEFNVWVDPDAARRVFRELDVTLVDWGVCTRDGVLAGEFIDDLAAAETDYAEFLATVSEPVRELNRGQSGLDQATQPDPLAAAVAIHPGIMTESGRYAVEVDERAGLTRGYTAVDEHGVTDCEAGTTVVESVDSELFREMIAGLARHGDPDRPLEG